jgi:protein SCO1/2
LSRGLETGDGCRLLRVTAGDLALKNYFSSGVNFTGSIVNRHRIEVFVLDAEGRIAATFQRLAWEPSEIVAETKAQLSAVNNAPESKRLVPASPLVHKGAALAPTLWALGLALLPKCPICGATYLSMTGIAALPQLQGFSQYWPVLLLLLLVNLAAVAWMSRTTRRWVPLVFAAAGTVLLAWPGLALGYDAAMTLGAVVIALGSLLALRGFNWTAVPAKYDPVSTPAAPAHSAG